MQDLRVVVVDCLPCVLDFFGADAHQVVWVHRVDAILVLFFAADATCLFLERFFDQEIKVFYLVSKLSIDVLKLFDD